MAEPTRPENPDRVEVDDPILIEDDGDSTYGTDNASSASTSLKSSVLKYEWKHGRRYHSYQSVNYQFPNDEQEQQRLDLTHHVFYRLLNNEIFLAPINPDGLRILDIGTGTGLWAIHLGDEYPGAEQIIGNDLSPIQSEWIPPNFQFVVDDVELDWAEPMPYDFIHCRYMAASIKDWPRLVKQIFDNIKPGGWVEFQETRNEIYAQDGSIKSDQPMVQMMTGIIEASENIGRTMNPAPMMEGWIKDAGFVNVTVQTFKLPIGGWPKDARLKEVGTLMGLNCIEGVEAFTAALFKDVMGWPQEEVLTLNAGVRNSVKKGEAHGIFDFLVITAQKPE